MQTIPIVESHYDSVPVFPLPTFVLFPQTTTRLHVFEPRYRQLVSDALSTQRLVVLVGLKPGWESDYYGTPPSYEIGTLARIVNEERLGDGRYNLYVHSLARVRLRTLHTLTPYRTAEVEVIHDEAGDAQAVEESMVRLVATVRGLMLQRGEHASALAAAISSTRKPAILTHRLASVLAFDPAVRQQLLETISVHDRCERLVELAGELLLRSTELELQGRDNTSDWIN